MVAPPLVIIGHSHTETVSAAAAAGNLSVDVLNFWHLADPFQRVDGRMTMAPHVAQRLVSPVFSMIGGAVHQDVGLIGHPRPFDFVLPEQPDLPVMPHADLLPFDAVYATLLERTAVFRDIMGAVRDAVTGALFHLESPPAYEREELPADDPGFYHLFGTNATFSPPWLRFKLWRLHSRIIAEHCRAIGIDFVPHPPEAVDGRGFLLETYHGTPAHANAAYGSLLLAQMRQRAANSARIVHPLASVPIAARNEASSQGEIEGWVDGGKDGTVRGWAWRPSAPAEKLVVELVAAGVVIGEAIAALQRADLAALGKAGGVCGFAITVDRAALAAVPAGVTVAHVRVRGGADLAQAVDLAEICQRGSGDADSSAAGSTSTDDAVCIWPPLPWKLGGNAIGYLDRFDPGGMHGWAQLVAAPSTPVVIALWEVGAATQTGECLGEVTAHTWRKDLEESRQGDGRWGLAAPIPAPLCNGRVHTLQLRLADGSAAFEGPVQIQFPVAATAAARLPEPVCAPAQEDVPSRRTRPARNDAPRDILFSVVVNFYNMRREAERTLTSLTRAYQRDIADLRYEVLCVDNFSDAPLDPSWIGSFGPEFRLIRPSRRLPSPCFALNEAASQARGRYIAMMIDGAHVLTPGVLREVWDATTEAPDGVVALRQWFVGGDQRWLATIGYTREQEDILFDKIAWPSDGYRLFGVGSPFWESPRPWFDAMIESNCLFVPAELYRRIGGMDEAFSEPGAGYANLDLFHRAIDASPEPVTAIIGEATFHQFHEGTTTNVTVQMKEQRVRRFESHYVEVRGKAYPVNNAVDIRVRGQIRTLHAVASWQRPDMPARIGATDRIRPGSLLLQFDESAQHYLQSVYVENRLHEQTTWLGHGLGMAPSDAMTLQDLVFRLRPGRIVTTNPSRGLLLFLASVLALTDLPASRIIAAGDLPAGLPEQVVPVRGPAGSPSTLATVEQALDTEEVVLVIFAPDAGDTVPAEALRAYARLVTPRSYLVFLGTAFGQPWLGYSRYWFMTAISRLLDSEPFSIDLDCNPHLLTTSPAGYLQRIEKPPHLAGD